MVNMRDDRKITYVIHSLSGYKKSALGWGRAPSERLVTETSQVRILPDLQAYQRLLTGGLGWTLVLHARSATHASRNYLFENTIPTD